MNIIRFFKRIFIKSKPNFLATPDSFRNYLSHDFTYTYLQFRLKYFIHDNQGSIDYRKLKTMWDGFLVGLENAYIIGLAKVILPLPRYRKGINKGKQKYEKQIAIETWLPKFKIRNQKAKKHLEEWRNKVLAHIDTGMIGMADRAHMTSLMSEALDAMAAISKRYEPSLDYKSELGKIAEQSEKDFLRLLKTIKTI